MHEGVRLGQIVPTLKNVSPQSVPHTLNLEIYPFLKTMDPKPLTLLLKKDSSFSSLNLARNLIISYH